MGLLVRGNLIPSLTKGTVMPKVGKMEFPYTPKGKAMAKKAAKKAASKKMVMKKMGKKK